MKKLHIPEKYRDQELIECYLKGLLVGYGIAQSETHRNLSPDDGRQHLLQKKVSHTDQTIGELVGRGF